MKYLLYLLLFNGICTAQDIINPKFKNKVDSLISKLNISLITVSELKQELSKKPIVLDVREKNEFLVSHLEGANFVSFDNYNFDKISHLLDKKRKIILYCSVGYRSGVITQKLREKGFDTYNLYGGIFEWINQGNSLVDNNGQRTYKVHGHNKNWSIWLDKGAKVYR